MKTPQKSWSVYLEGIVFLGFMLASLVYIWGVPAFISLDGPSHVYNASLMSRLDSSPFLQQYLQPNYFFLPNYLSHWLLQLLLKVFDLFTAEKLLISIVAVFLPISMRMLIRSVTKDVPYYSFLVYPLVLTNLLHCGFYNFSLGFIFFNLHLYLITKLSEQRKPLRWLLLVANAFLLYYSQIFAFGLALLTGGIFLLIRCWPDKKNGLRILLWFAVLHIPLLVFSVLFITHVPVPNYDVDTSTYQKVQMLTDFGPGIAFNTPAEEPYAVLIPVLMIVLVVTALTLRHSDHKKLRAVDVFLFSALLSIYLIFHTKSGQMGGMFTNRLVFIAFYFLMIWIACNPVKGYLKLASILVVIISINGIFRCRIKSELFFHQMVIDTEMARKYIKDKSLVRVCSLTNNWIEGHVTSYLGVNKEVVMLDNYEAQLGWFPLSWTEKGRQLVQNQTTELSAFDYIVVYGNREAEQEQLLSAEEKKAIAGRMTKLYESSDGLFRLYGAKQPAGR